jgi:hypothetical protein
MAETHIPRSFLARLTIRVVLGGMVASTGLSVAYVFGRWALEVFGWL